MTRARGNISKGGAVTYLVSMSFIYRLIHVSRKWVAEAAIKKRARAAPKRLCAMDLYDVDRHRRHVPVSVRLLPIHVYVFVFRSNLWEEGKVQRELGA